MKRKVGKKKSNTSRPISRFVRRQPPRQFSYIQISGHPLLGRHCAEECLVAGKPAVHDECGHRQQDGCLPRKIQIMGVPMILLSC